MLPVRVIPPTDTLTHRLWRLRRRHDHLDARVQPVGTGWTLTFVLNDRELLTTTFDTREAAVEDAEARRRDLVRVGWNLHW
jgi:hypothetical protein